MKKSAWARFVGAILAFVMAFALLPPINAPTFAAGDSVPPEEAEELLPAIEETAEADIEPTAADDQPAEQTDAAASPGVMEAYAPSDFAIADGVLTAYTGAGGAVVLPEGVTELGAAAFQNNKAVTGITLYEGLEKIGAGAFDRTGLTGTLALPSTMESVGDYAFRDCTGLTGFVLNDGLKAIGNGAFYNCENMTGNLKLPVSITAIGNYTFYYCRNLTGSLTIPDSVTTIGNYAFYDCYGLSGALTLNEGITTIGNHAFYYCSKLTGDLIIPDSVTSLGEQAFYGCSGFNGILHLSANLTKIPNYAFEYCSKITGELVIPDKVETIGYQAFYNMVSLESVVFGEGIQSMAKHTEYVNDEYGYSYSIDAGPLYGAEKLREITFMNMKNFSTFYSTFYGLFEGMPALECVHISGADHSVYARLIIDELPTGVKLDVYDSAGDFIIEDGVLTAYIGSGGVVQIPDGVIEIAKNAFYRNTSVTEIIFNDGLEKIGEYAFAYSGIKGNLNIPGSVTTIGSYAFYYCTEVDGMLTLNDGIESISNYAFSNCTGLTGDLEIPGSVAVIGNDAFYYCTGLNGTLTLHDGLVAIGNYAFGSCSELTGNLDIPGSVTVIGQDAFTRCSELNGTLTLNEGIVTIGNWAFNSCSKLTGDLFIPNSVVEIGSYAFSGCSGFNGSLRLPESAVEVRGNAFSGCKGFTGELVIADNIITIYASAFHGVPGLKSPNGTDFVMRDGVILLYTGNGGTVELPSDTVAIGDEVFWENATITKIIFNDGINKIGDSDFRYCKGITGTLELPESLSYIGGYAFDHCTGIIGTLELPEKLTYIGRCAFEYCTGLTGNIEIPGGVTGIGSYAFYYCTGLDGVLTLNKGIKTIGDRAFYNCENLKGSLIIPEGMTSIGDFAFYDCDNLIGDLIIPDSVTYIGDSAFFNCNKFTGDLIIPDSVTDIGNSAFAGCYGFNGRLKLSANLEEISAGAFISCSGITGVLTIPDNVTLISSSAFSYMSKITSMIIGEKVTQIRGVEDDHYYYYSSYSHQNSETPFYRMSSLSEITFKGLTAPHYYEYFTGWEHYEIFDGLPALKTVRVPSAAYSDYVTRFSYDLPVGVQIVPYDEMEMPVGNPRAEAVFSKSAMLAWSKHIAGSVVKYTVSRDGVAVGETAECSFYDSGLETGETYSYQIKAVTADGAETAAATVTVKTAAPEIGSITTDYAQNRLIPPNNSIYVTSPNTKNHGSYIGATTAGEWYYISPEDGGRVLIGAAVADSVTGASATYVIYWILGDISDGVYTVVFVLTDADGVSAEKSAQIIVDRALPQQIQNVSAMGDISGVTLSWSISAEVETTRYAVYRRSDAEDNYTNIAIVNSRNTLSYRDASAIEDVLYHYYITGIDNYDREGPASETVSDMKGADDEKPQVTKLTPANASYINGAVGITATATDNVSVTKVELSYSTDNGATWEAFAAPLDTTALPDGAVRVRAIAYDARSNESDSLTYTYHIDNTAPEQVNALSYISTSVTVTLTWSDVADNDFNFFRVERKNADGTYTTVTDVKTLGANITGLMPDTEHVYRVIAYDRLGNRGTPSEDIVTRIAADTTAPVITALAPRPTSGVTSYYSSNVTFSATASDDHAIGSIVIQTSTDTATWDTVQTFTYPDIQAKRTATR
jgi:hypothetical protein